MSHLQGRTELNPLSLSPYQGPTLVDKSQQNHGNSLPGTFVVRKPGTGSQTVDQVSQGASAGRGKSLAQRSLQSKIDTRPEFGTFDRGVTGL
jgi:hypothetical protein